MRKRLFLMVGLCLMAFAAFASLAHTAPPETPKAPHWYALANSSDAGGLWVQRTGEGKPVGALYASTMGGQDNAVLGFYRDTAKAGAHDFAIVAEKTGVWFQVIDDNGKFHAVPATALLKLASPEPKVALAVNPVEAVAGIGKGELRKRIVLEFVRHRAVELAVKDGIKSPDGKVRKVTRDEAEKLVDGVRDDVILGAAIEQGAPVEGGRLEGLVNWLWEHREQLIRLILSLLALFADESP